MERTSEIWTYLAVVLAVMALHFALLWRHLRTDALRIELMLLEWRLAMLNQAHPQARGPALLRLQHLLADFHRGALDLVYSRVVLAGVLIPENSRGVTCRQQLEIIQPLAAREAAMEILDQTENAVARRMLFGSPVLWVLALMGLIRAAVRPASGVKSRGIARYVSGIHLLEFTFLEGSL